MENTNNNFFNIVGNLDYKTMGAEADSINTNLDNINIINGVMIIDSDGSTTTRDEIIIKKKTYTPAHLKAQTKYRDKNREKYNEAQRLLYEKKIQEEEWRKHYLERSRLNNQKHREKKKQELIEKGEYVEKKRGRPRKTME